jgi:hypothetical protein
MQGGTFQSSWSFCDGSRGGELITGVGRDRPGRGSRLLLNLGGTRRSSGISERLTNLLVTESNAAEFRDGS